MQLVKWSDVAGTDINRFGSARATHAPLARAVGESAFGLIRIEHGGRLGRHPAVARQALLVLEGSGRASGEDNMARPIQAGDLLLWEPGEEHETIAEEPMLLLIVEADELTIPAVDEHQLSR